MIREECQAFGQELVRLRKERGVGLDEITRDTKIRRQVIEAFEAGRFEELPPEVFAVGFLRAYAEKLGIPADPLVARYRKILRPAPEPPPVSRRARRGGKGAPWAAATGGFAVLLAGALAASWLMGWWPFEGVGPAPSEAPLTAPTADSAAAATEPSPEPPQEAPSSEALPSASPASPEAGGTEGGETAPGPAPGGMVPMVESDTRDEPPSPQPAVRAPAPEPPIEGDLILVCTEPCWVDLRGDGRRLLRREMAPGERLVFKGSDFRADIGNAAGLQITYRGRAVPLQGRPGQVLKDLRLPIAQDPP
ncbi:MAG: RodZ domain-containing protein [Acidobacteriota bacterium]